MFNWKPSKVAKQRSNPMVTEEQISVKNKEFIMMRYGVVGVGYFGADLARFMNEFDDAQITMVYDPENGGNHCSRIHNA